MPLIEQQYRVVKNFECTIFPILKKINFTRAIWHASMTMSESFINIGLTSLEFIGDKARALPPRWNPYRSLRLGYNADNSEWHYTKSRNVTVIERH